MKFIKHNFNFFLIFNNIFQYLWITAFKYSNYLILNLIIVKLSNNPIK